MKAAVLKEVENLRRLSVTGLRDKYLEVFGEESRAHHKDFLFRRIAYSLCREYLDHPGLQRAVIIN